MRLNIKILESYGEINKRILNALLPDCAAFMKKAAISLKKTIPYIIADSIKNRPEYQSLTSGNLRLELGIVDANTKVEELIGFWINNMLIEYVPPMASGNKIKSKLSISMIKTDFSDILGSSAAYVIDNIRGYSLPWLEWLLLDGSKAIVPGYSVIFGPNKRSRTGGAVMRVTGGDWRVPSEHAGTISDNWITRAIDDTADEINKELERVLS